MAPKTKSIDKYEIFLDERLGNGNFGIVYKGRNKETNEPVAAKILNRDKIASDEYLLASMKCEMQIMKKLKSPNIVCCHDFFETSNNFYIIQEYCGGGNLGSLLKKEGKLPEKKALQILIQILTGWQELIRNGIIHRDIKPDNILISDDCFKIADFGFAKSLGGGYTKMTETGVGTPLYESLQILEGEKYTSRTDIWSLAIMIYQILYGTTPWPARNQIELVKGIKTKPLTFPAEPVVSAPMKNFLKGCLGVKEKDRLDWLEVYKHPLVADQFVAYRQKLDELEYNSVFLLNQMRLEIHQSKADVTALWQEYAGKDGKLKFDQFKCFAQRIDKNISDEGVKCLFRSFDKDGDGVIDQFEFLLAAQYPPSVKLASADPAVQQLLYLLCKAVYTWEINIESLFNKYVKSENTYQTQSEFNAMLREMDKTLPKEVGDMLWKYFDMQGIGRLYFASFSGMLDSLWNSEKIKERYNQIDSSQGMPKGASTTWRTSQTNLADSQQQQNPWQSASQPWPYANLPQAMPFSSNGNTPTNVGQPRQGLPGQAGNPWPQYFAGDGWSKQEPPNPLD